MIRTRNNLAANWASANAVLTKNCLAMETDTNKMKIGDGVSKWLELPYFGESEGTAKTDVNFVISTGIELDTAVGTYYGVHNQSGALTIVIATGSVIGGKATQIIKADGSGITFTGMTKDPESDDIDNTVNHYNLIEYIKQANSVIYYTIKNLS
jgi:hypothetical protein